MILSFLSVAIYFGATNGGTYHCPNTSQVLPCKCQEDYFGLEVFCESMHGDYVRKPLKEVAKTNQPVAELTLKDIRLPNLPPNFFVGPDVHLIKVEECHTSTVDENAFVDVAPQLKWLYITGNPLNEVPTRALQKLSKLQYLYLEDNMIEILHAEAFVGLDSLLQLWLHGNRIQLVADAAFVGIRSSRFSILKLGGNQLTAVPREPLRNLSDKLMFLELNNNKITSLTSEDFDVMDGEHLIYLYLANNTIRHLPAGVFKSLKRLFKFDLSGNGMESIHPLAFEGTGDNPLHCDCNLTWLADWINGTGSEIVILANETKYATPEIYATGPLEEMPSDAFICGDSTTEPPEACFNFIANCSHELFSNDYFATLLRFGLIYLLTKLGMNRQFQ